MEKLLKETIETAKREKFISKNELCRVNVDTTVQEKAIAFPTDTRLYFKALRILVKEAKHRGIKLRQSYHRKGKISLIKQGRYAHAQQMKRAKRETKRLRIYLGRVIRDIRRKELKPDGKLENLLRISERIFNQQRNDKNKIYSIHAPEVECISKGKVHKKYEFGCKVSIVTTSKSNWIVGVQAIHGNPFDGHTLIGAIDQMEELTGARPVDAYVDMGYRGEVHHPKDVNVHLSNKSRKRMTRWQKLWMRRRSAIEPIISHVKHGHRMDRNYLQGTSGDKINALLAASGCNLRKLMRAFFFHLEIFSLMFKNRVIFYTDLPIFG
jgi:IS5 family transposase